MEYKIILPFAPILVESTRSIGYSFESALADIIDNSVSKGAKKIFVNYDSMEPQYAAVIDDGCGMDPSELELAMRYGSKSSLETRDQDDLGRFGLGLKMASLSQCRKLTVATKKNGIICAAQWNLDLITERKDWVLLWYNENDIDKIRFIGELRSRDSGTIVIWEDFDRTTKGSADKAKTFDEKIEIARNHISLVFHRFIGDENPSQRINIYFNKDRVEPVDPFLLNNAATQPLVEQTFVVEGSEIKVKPYVLPYVSKLSSKDKKQLGDINDLRLNQGFYVYRNKRLIIWGTWFRLIKQYELNKLARVRVDIPNTLDSIWEIDIKKSRASLPDMIKKQLVSIVGNAVGRSENVYKYRGRKLATDDLQHIWNIIDNRGKIQYLVNRDIPLFKQLENSLDDNGQRYLDSLIKTIEDAFPFNDVYYRSAKNESNTIVPSLDFDQVYKIGVDTIESMRSQGLDVKQFLATIDKFDFFAKYQDVIEKLREDFGND